MSICNQLDLQTLGSPLYLTENLPGGQLPPVLGVGLLAFWGHSRLGYYFQDKGLKDFVASILVFITIYYYLINKFYIDKYIVHKLYQEILLLLFNNHPEP